MPQAVAATPAPPVGLVLDVRSEPEFRSGAVEGALNLPLAVLAYRIREVAPDRATPLQLYCASGGRSEMGRQLLLRLGYADVTNVGGLHDALRLCGRRR
ncbi:MAG: rhodanese-like domain-containing protein [Ideonella sp.]|nr:rhodanese-like domain-containing protein [Ideonella sp.]